MKALPGAFKMCDTHGLPLEILVQLIDDRDMVIAWDAFVDDARAHGWLDKTIRRKAIAAVTEVFPPNYVEQFTLKLDIYMRNEL